MKTATVKKVDVPVSVLETEDRLSVGASVKLSRKIEPQDVFVTMEASCNYSTLAPKENREEIKQANMKFVRITIKEQLAKVAAMVQKQLEE